MTRFVEITQNGTKARINPDHVLMVAPDGGIVGRSILILANGAPMKDVLGSVDEVANRLEGKGAEIPY